MSASFNKIRSDSLFYGIGNYGIGNINISEPIKNVCIVIN